MSNQLTASGLTVNTLSEIVDALVLELQTIYGTDINVDQNSPDGQLINIFAQAVADQLALLVQVYNSFSVPNAFGVALDQRVALNGLARREGTYTLIEVALVVSQTVDLQGLDGDDNAAAYTVEDGSGNRFCLVDSATITSPGATKQFRARDVGIVETSNGEVLQQVTIITGVTSATTSSIDQIGTAEETDSQLKIRHDRSFFLGSQSPADAVEAALLATDGVTDAYVAENVTGSEASGVDAHSIWAIVVGGTDADVANAIYMKKAPGCGMTGSEAVTVTRPNGSTMIIKFDRAVDEDLYITFSILPKSPGIVFDDDAIKAALVVALQYSLNQSANIGDVVIAMLAIAPQGILTDVGVSTDGMSYLDVVTPASFQNKFVLDTTRIIIT